jgi:hypothetical protein
MEGSNLAELCAALPTEGYFLEVRTFTAPSGFLCTPKIYPFFDENENRLSFGIGEVRPKTQGRYLRLLIGSEDSVATDCLKFLMRTITRVRLAGGIGAALYEVERTVKDVPTGKTTNSDFVGLWEPVVGRDLTSLRDQAGFAWQNIRYLRQDQWLHSLIGAAVQATENEPRFIFLWIALEGIIGAGKDREKFFLEELGSSILNEEAYRIFLVRNAVFHDAKLEDGVTESIRLFEILRIAMLPACELREQLVKELENRVAVAKVT